MAKARHFLLAGGACLILVLLSLTVGLDIVIPFESIAAEIGFVTILTVGAALLLGQGLWMIINRNTE